MIVLDIETSGTDPLKHSVLSIGAVDLSNPDRQFFGECKIVGRGAHFMKEALVRPALYFCWYHMMKRGIVPPEKNRKTTLNSDVIMGYVGIPAEPKPHKALNGARFEAEAMHRLIYDRLLKIPWLKNGN